MRLLINNFLDSATLTPNNPSSAFPSTNLYNDQLTERCQFDSTLVIDLGSTMNVTAVAFGNSNENITLEANSTNSWGSPPFSQALTSSVTFIDEDYRYWRINTGVSGSRIGYFYLGQYLQLPYHENNNIGKPNNTDITSITATRGIYSTPGVIYNEESVNFPVVTLDEYEDFETWWRSRDRVKNHYYVPFENEMNDVAPYFAKVISYEPNRDGLVHSFKINIVEAK